MGYFSFLRPTRRKQDLEKTKPEDTKPLPCKRGERTSPFALVILNDYRPLKATSMYALWNQGKDEQLSQKFLGLKKLIGMNEYEKFPILLTIEEQDARLTP